MDGFHLAILFSVGVAGFLLGCLASLLFEPSDELGGDDPYRSSFGDWPSRHDEFALFHERKE